MMKLIPALFPAVVALASCGSGGTACRATVASTRLVEIACPDGPQGICFSEVDSGF